MSDKLRKKILLFFWSDLLLSAVFLYFDLVYSFITEPLVVPLLALYLFIGDNNIAKPFGKLIFFAGMFLAFLGDVLQVAINNEIFFFGSLIAFMLMNICYSYSFYALNTTVFRKPVILLPVAAILWVMAYFFLQYLGDAAMGDFKIPLIVYMFFVSMMISLAISLLGHSVYKKLALQWLVPGVLVFMVQNIFLAINLFQLGSANRLYMFSIVPYGIAQFLIVKGMQKIYGKISHTG